MQSIRKYRNWAVLLLVVFAATSVAVGAPTQSAFAQLNSVLAPNGATPQGLTATGGTGAAPQGWVPAQKRPGTDAKTVAFLGAEYAPLATYLKDSLVAYGHTVTDIPCVAYTPTLGELQAYEAVVLWSNYAFADAEAIGNVVADYVDGGGRLIMSTFVFYSSPGWGIGGRIKSDAQYQTISYSGSFDFQDRASGWYDAGNPITQDLSTPVHGYYRHSSTLASGATLLAEWTGGIPFVVQAANQEVICINLYPGNDENYYWYGPYGKLWSNAIEWSSGPPQADDIGCSGILAPPTVSPPFVSVPMIGRVKNYGTNAQTGFWLYATVRDPANTLVYADSAQFTGTLNQGDTSHVVLPNWMPGAELSYNVRMFTALVGDTKPKNDTAKRTVATIGWEDIPPLTDDANRLINGTVYDIDQDMLYMMGGNPDGYSGTNVTRMQRYDPISMTWANMAPMPTARGWISAAYVAGKIYVMAGHLNSGTAGDMNEAYDVASNTWATMAPVPRQTLAYAQAVYDNRLIYLMGGLNSGLSGGTNFVNIYDPAANSWTTGTNLPFVFDMGSAAIIGDTIFIAQAYNRSSGQGWPNLYKGAINPGNPSEITWIAGPALSPNVSCGGTAALDEVVYWMGGFTDNFSSVTNKLWKYSTETGVMENFSVANYPKTIARNDFLVARNGAGSELYCLAGDLDGNWSSPNNEYRKLAFPAKDNDLGVAVITEPVNAQLVPGSTIAPTCYVKNYGQLDQVGSDVSLIITDASGAEMFNGTVQVDVATGESTLAVFPDFTIPDSLFIGRTFAFRTLLPMDQRPANDAKTLKTMTLTDEVFSYAGAEAPEIDGTIAAGEWDDAFTFDCSNIFGWNGVPQGPGAAYAYFKNDGSYLYVGMRMPEAMSRDNGDKVGLCIDENNDGAWDGGLTEGEYQLWVNGTSSDEVQFRYHSPSTIGQWGSVNGALSASTTYDGYLVFEARIPIGTQAYKLQLNNPSNDTVGLYLYALDGSKYYGWFKAGLDDDDWNTPSLYGKLVFMATQAGDVGVASITVPAGTYQPNTAITPVATWRNFGTTAMTGTAYLFLTDPSGARVYSQSQPFSLNGGQSVNPTFIPYTLVDTGTWAVKCSTAAAGDNNATNNIRTGTFVVRTFVALPGWHAKTPVIGGAFVKDGGAMAYNGDAGFIYEMKGNKTLEFNAYSPVDTIWTALATIPAGVKPVKGGASMATGAGKVFITKGNNTLEFYRFDIETGAWLPATKTVPLGGGKKVKAGGSMAFVSKTEGDFVYMLKGYGTEFYKYDVTYDSFTPLADAPAGAKPKYDKGSWIAYDGEQYLYVSKAKYGEFYKYDVLAEAWVTTPTLPVIPLVDGMGKKKKVGDGSSAAFGDGALYAFKGNNNNTFWKYTPGDSSGAWAELETIPQVAVAGEKKKKVKGGAALTYVPDLGAFYAQKGNKSSQFWQYVPNNTVMAGERPTRDGVAAGSVTNVALSMAVSPNPLATGYATLRYSLPKSGVVTLNVYDVTGRSVVTRTLSAGRTGSTGLDLRNLSAGVYLVKLSSDGFSTSQKLVVER